MSKENSKHKATIYYYDIGDYLDREEKLINKLIKAKWNTCITE